MTTLKKEIEKTKAELKEHNKSQKELTTREIVDSVKAFRKYHFGWNYKDIELQATLSALQLTEKIEQENLKKVISEEKIYWECNVCKLLFPPKDNIVPNTCNRCGNDMFSNSTKRKMVLSYKTKEVFEK
jgi:rubrerythrin